MQGWNKLKKYMEQCECVYEFYALSQSWAAIVDLILVDHVFFGRCHVREKWLMRSSLPCLRTI